MKRKRGIVTGIDIGTRMVRVVQAEWNADEAFPHIIGTGMAESHGLRHGYIVNQEETARNIRVACDKAEKASGIKIQRAFISAGGVGLESIVTTGSVMISRADGEITELDIKKTGEVNLDTIPALHNKQIIYTIPLGYRLDGKEVLGRPLGMKGKKLEAMLLHITSIAQHIHDTQRAVEMAGIDVEDILPSPIAAAHVTATRGQLMAGCVLANIGADTVSIVVFENSIPISLKVFAAGGTILTNKIALGLKVSLEEAEAMKTGDGSADLRFPKKKVDDIVSEYLGEVFQLIESHLKKIGKNELLPAGVIITGGGSGISAITDFAKASLRLPSRIGYPAFGTDPTKPADGRSIFKGEIRNIPAWTVAYGMCIMGFSSNKEDKNGLASVKALPGKISDFFKQFLP